MHWTTTKPSRPGWYWYRRTDLPFTDDPDVVHVSTLDYQPGLYIWDWQDTYWEPISSYNGQWAGPIPEPTEHTEGV